MITIPADFPVQPVTDAATATSPMTCGTCELTWDDAIATSWTPVPGARCPFEYFHEGDTMIDFDTVTDEISNYEDTIDSRDVIARIEELAELEEAANEADEDMPRGLAEELATLRKLASQGEDIEDWEYGATLVRESYFDDYYRELIEDTSDDVSDWTAFPYRHIDWEAVAEEGKTDYTSIDFNGETYWVR